MHNGKGEKAGKVSESVPEVIDKLFGDVAAKGKTALSDVMDETGEILSAKFGSLKSKASEWGLDEVADEVGKYVRKNPWKSLGIAVGVGFLMNSFLKSSRKED